jgi:hypothetical protein
MDLQPAAHKVYYAARGHICKFCIKTYYKITQ